MSSRTADQPLQFFSNIGKLLNQSFGGLLSNPSLPIPTLPRDIFEGFPVFPTSPPQSVARPTDTTTTAHQPSPTAGFTMSDQGLFSSFNDFLNVSFTSLGDVIKDGIMGSYNDTHEECAQNVSCWLSGEKLGFNASTDALDFVQGLVDIGTSGDGFPFASIPDIVKGFDQYLRTVYTLNLWTYISSAVCVVFSLWIFLLLVIYRPLHHRSNLLLSHLTTVSFLLPAALVPLQYLLNAGRERTDNPFQFNKDHGSQYWLTCQSLHLFLSSLTYTQLLLLLLVALERAVAVWRPALHQRWTNTFCIRHIAPISCWVCGFGVGMVELTGLSEEGSPPPLATLPVCSFELSHSKALLIASLSVEVILSVVACVTYVLVLVGAKEKRHMSKQAQIPVESLSGPDWRSQSKTTKLWAAITVIYVAFLIPSWAAKISGVIAWEAVHGQSSALDFLKRMRYERIAEMLRRIAIIFMLLPTVLVLPALLAKYRSARQALRSCCCCKRFVKEADGRVIRVAYQNGGLDVRRSAVQVSTDSWPDGVTVEDGDVPVTGSAEATCSNSVGRSNNNIYVDTATLTEKRAMKEKQLEEEDNIQTVAFEA